MNLLKLEEYGVPEINVIDITLFEKRVQEVFKKVASVLANTYGPYGSNTIIGDYPYHYLTKDGFHITKYLAFNGENGPIDNMILKLIISNSDRLNNTVGDGTTTAIIATNAIYDNYITSMGRGSVLADASILPRVLMENVKECGEKIIEKIKSHKLDIASLEKPEKLDMVKNIAYISSNGSKEITENIVDIYEQIDSPVINVDLSKTGESYIEYGHGCILKIFMGDPCYVNNDNNTCKLNNVDVVMFSHKVHEGTLPIINELVAESSKRKRQLLVLAPMYDNRSIQALKVQIMQTISKYGYSPLVLATAEVTAGVSGDMYQDLSVILNTTVITRTIEDNIARELKDGEPITELFNIDGRHYIEDLWVKDSSGAITNKTEEGYKPQNPYLNLGYCENVELGVKHSVFNGFYYDKNIFAKLKQNVEFLYKDAMEQSKSTSGFSIKAVGYRKRLAMINMKSVTYYVGGETHMSQEMNKDVIDDAVKAVDSAMNHGIIRGCSVTTMQSINELYNTEEDSVKKEVYNIFLRGFEDVATTLFRNAGYDKYTAQQKDEILSSDTVSELKYNDQDTLIGAIIETCINTGKVFDLETKTFTDKVINSANTDIEIVKVITDLLGLLVSGNQLILSMR